MEPSSEKRLRADLEEARDALETVSGSLRFQMGDAFVSALSGGGTFASRARRIMSAVQRARSLLAYSRIRRKIFSGLPHDGLPKFPASVALEELRALEKYVSARSGNRIGIKHAGPLLRSHWSASLIELVGEFRQAIDRGYDFEIAKQPIRLSAADQKRIVYVTQHDPDTSVNGYARRTREIVRGLEANGFSVLLVTPPKAGAPGSGKGLRAHVDALAGTIKAAALRHKAGLIHCASNYLNGLAAITAARSMGIPCVYEVRGLWEETRRTIDKSFGDSVGYQLQARMEVCCADNADVTIIGSAGIGEELARRGANAARFFLAESGSPDLTADQTAGGLSGRKLFPAGSRVLGFVGSVTSYEGFSTIARALAILAGRDDRYKMLVVGEGPFLSEAKDLFRRAGVIEKTLFEGRQPFDAALAYYREIDLALYPRDSTHVTETVESLKPAEAVSAGVPVIVSNVRPLASFIANCPSVFAIKASDASDLAGAVERFFARSEEKRWAIGIAGREWALANRTWAHTVMAIQKAYQSLL
jgi:glycosyltransferase involved in cell wall biosynthesis